MDSPDRVSEAFLFQYVVYDKIRLYFFLKDTGAENRLEEQDVQEKWMEKRDYADFKKWGEALGCSPFLARLLRNRMETVEEARDFLYASPEDLGDARGICDMEKAVRLISRIIREGGKIAVAADYDCDGIFSGQILKDGLERLGASVKVYTPNRVKEGYGLNEEIVDKAVSAGCRMILTCDNGITAIDEIAYARKKGLFTVVTDHHEPIRKTGPDGAEQIILPEADAVVDPKRPDSLYPFREMCGAGVAFRLMELLFEEFGVPRSELRYFYEYVGIATIADVVPLRGDNRILAKAGIQALRETGKVPLNALIEVSGIRKDRIGAYHVSYILSPSFNAIGRLGDASHAFRFLSMTDPDEALKMAEDIRSLNEARKAMTEDSFREAVFTVEEEGLLQDPVLVLRLDSAHQSIIGLIAGRLKEKYSRPVIVFTKTDEGVLKGSGRSIDACDLISAIRMLGPLVIQAGGHKKAAGLEIREEDLEAFRREINLHSGLTDEDLVPVVWFDGQVALSHWNTQTVRELDLLEPCGEGNPKPLFALGNVHVSSPMILGRNANVLKVRLEDQRSAVRSGFIFHDPELFFEEIRSAHGEKAEELFRERRGEVLSAFVYYPELREYRGEQELQIILKHCKMTGKGV